MSKHTELPWLSPETMIRDGGPAFAPVVANTLIAKVYSTAYKDDAQALANAAFIVRACNSHYELLEALRLHKAWADSERSGPNYGGLSRDSHPDGEKIWRAWWEYNLDLCDRAEKTTNAVISKAEAAT